jgi:hypothetical protein
MPPWTVSKFPGFSIPYGFNPSLASGVNISGSSTANTKGSYAELTPATAFDTDGMYIYFQPDALSTMTNTFLVDLARGGAGSETILIHNMPCTGGRGTAQVVFIPITITSGTRLSVRCQVLNVGSNQRGLNMAIVTLPRSYTASNVNRDPVCTTYGANTADSGGVQVDPGATPNTKGAWSEVTPVTTMPILNLIAYFNLISNATASTARFLIDIGIGGSGSEQAIITDIPVGELVGSDGLNQPVFGPVPIYIPAGTRLSARAQCSIADATDRLFDIVLQGVG